MLALSPLSTSKSIKDERERGEMEIFSIGDTDFLDFSGGNLLDIIDFDLFEGMGIDGDVLPDLEMDPEMFMEFSSSGGEEQVSSPERIEDSVRKGEEEVSGSGSFAGSGSGPSLNQGEEIMSKREELNSSSKEGEKGRKSSGSSKNSQGKRKVKVDWTPELHRRFVQAVEQLGVDKAVPSRILELMGIDCLTRHNIASHLQKYRSHRKHLLAREAEAATWTHKRHMYSGGGGSGSKKKMNPWLAPVPIMGFPHPPPPPMTPMQHFRPLHVWGHPPHHDAQSAMMHHHRPVLRLPVPPPAAWGQTLHPSLPRPPPPNASFWQRVPNSLTPGTPCFPPPMATARFSAPPVPGIPPHAVFRPVDHPARPTGPHPPSDFHPSKESIDEAIGDVLTKPWLPLPLGLKPPSMDSVMGELQRQGVPNIPPTSAGEKP